MSIATTESKLTQVLEILEQWFECPVRECTGVEVRVDGQKRPIATYHSNRMIGNSVDVLCNPVSYSREDDKNFACAVIKALEPVCNNVFNTSLITKFEFKALKDSVVEVSITQALDFK